MSIANRPTQDRQAPEDRAAGSTASWVLPTPPSPDTASTGAYLAESRNGLTRDELTEALDWTLLRVERALARLDTTLDHSGMRLALNADRIIIVGRLGRTDLQTRSSLERLAAGDPDPKLGAVIWSALDGFAPDRTTDFESLETADRLGLTCGRQGRIRVTDPVHYSLRPTNNHR